MSDEEIKIEVYKTEDGKNRLVLASVYKNNCSKEKTVIVDDDVLEIFKQSCRDRERERSRNRRHGLKKIYLGSNEDFDAKLGLIADPPDETVQSKLYFEYLKRFFDDKVYKRGMMYYFHGFTQREIAKIEGVSQEAVSKSIIAFKETMAKLYKIKP